MPLTTDPNDPELRETEPNGMQKSYLVLPQDTDNFVRPIRYTYLHSLCQKETSMSRRIAETYAQNPTFYGATYCYTCKGHYPVGADGQFTWVSDGTKVGT